MRVRCYPADVMGPWPGGEAPVLAGRNVLQRVKLGPFPTLAENEQATRLRPDVERSVRRADSNREDVPLGQLHALPSPSAVAAEDRPIALRASEHAVAIRRDAADRDALEHRLSFSRRVIKVEA